jgi:cytochrome P450
LLDRVESRGHMDVVADFAFPLPLTAICELLNIPEADRDFFFDPDLRSDGRALEAATMNRHELDKANARIQRLEQYFVRLLDARRHEPGEDLITHLVEAENAPHNALCARELISNVIFLFAAGHETTANLIGNSLLALWQHPRELAAVRADPTLLPQALDEFVRYGAPVQIVARTASADMDIGGKTIAKGDFLMGCLGAANRDPAVFPDPHRLDLARRHVRPLSFGGGIHYCIGAQLARIELEIALATFLRRLPQVQLHDVDNPKWRPRFVLRGLEELPASW